MSINDSYKMIKDKENQSRNVVIVRLILIIFLNSGLLFSAFGKGKFSLEFLPGGAVIIPSTLNVYQEGFPDIKFKAVYRTESFILPIYYSYRAGFRINDNSTMELEMNHLKVILDNNPPEIEVFSITHGFNQLWVNYALNYKGFVIRTGIGPVIAHPEIIIRGKRLDTEQSFAKKGYYINGVTSQLAVQIKIFLGNHFYFSAETKLNAAFSKIKIAYGFANVPIFAWHGLIGFGVTF